MASKVWSFVASAEVMDGMLESRAEPTWEEIDHWVNCHNVAASIPEWYERVAEFKVAR